MPSNISVQIRKDWFEGEQRNERCRVQYVFVVDQRNEQPQCQQKVQHAFEAARRMVWPRLWRCHYIWRMSQGQAFDSDREGEANKNRAQCTWATESTAKGSSRLCFGHRWALICIFLFIFYFFQFSKNSMLFLANFNEFSKFLCQVTRIFIFSAGASEPKNMAYMVRLGLWGKGTPFNSCGEFLNAVERR